MLNVGGFLILEDRLDYHFVNQSLLVEALTHSSSGFQPNNERLEFLGDAVLDLAVADILFARDLRLSEGQMSQTRANLVCQDGLCRIADRLGLAGFLSVGGGEDSRRSSILSSALEAVIGAVFMDSGYNRCATVVCRLIAPELQSCDPQKPRLSAKTLLNEVSQRLFRQNPKYTNFDWAHLGWSASVAVGPEQMACGSGASKKAAEESAAAKLLAVLSPEDLERLNPKENHEPQSGHESDRQ